MSAWSVGWSVSVCHNFLKDSKLPSHAQIGTLVLNIRNQPPKPKQVFFSSAKVLRECRGNSAEEFRNFDGIANFLFG